MCSHILEIADKVCTHAVILDHGKVLAQGPIASFRTPGRDLADTFLDILEKKEGSPRAA